MKKKTVVAPFERRCAARAVEVRSVEGQPTTIVGYAALFGVEAVVGDLFRERIEPGAFRSVLAAADVDVCALFNHDENFVLARTTNGTLRLSEDSRGLRYEFEPNPDDPDAVGVVAKIKRGDVTQSSFGFRVADDGQAWTRSASRSELPLRTITAVDFLRDVSPVTYPVFEQTTAEARSAAAVAVRAAATNLTPEAAEEAAELIQYRALQACLTQLTDLISQATPLVDALIADETEAPTETVETEAVEETLESARLTVLMTQAQQLCGVASGYRSLLASLAPYGYGYYSSGLATERAKLDLMDLEV